MCYYCLIACVYFLYVMASSIYFALESHIWSIMSVISFFYSLFGRHVCFFSLMQTTFYLMHLSVSIPKASVREVLSDSHSYFTFGSHICSNMQ